MSKNWRFFVRFVTKVADYSKLRLACCYALHVVFDKSLSWAFVFEFQDVIQTKITSPICSTTALDKNLDSENWKIRETDVWKFSISSCASSAAQS